LNEIRRTGKHISRAAAVMAEAPDLFTRSRVIEEVEVLAAEHSRYTPCLGRFRCDYGDPECSASHGRGWGEVAGTQGKFWEMHDMLFEHQHVLEDDDLVRYAAPRSASIAPDSSASSLDTTLLRAYREFVKDPADREIRDWLKQLATEQLEAEVKRLKSKRERTVHIEEDIRETPPTEEVSLRWATRSWIFTSRTKT
jgi:hypothetical protein